MSPQPMLCGGTTPDKTATQEVQDLCDTVSEVVGLEGSTLFSEYKMFGSRCLNVIIYWTGQSVRWGKSEQVLWGLPGQVLQNPGGGWNQLLHQGGTLAVKRTPYGWHCSCIYVVRIDWMLFLIGSIIWHSFFTWFFTWRSMWEERTTSTSGSLGSCRATAGTWRCPPCRSPSPTRTPSNISNPTLQKSAFFKNTTSAYDY